MESSKIFEDGNLIIWASALIGGIIVITGAFWGARVNERNAALDYDRQVDTLQTTIKEQTESLAEKDVELQKKADQIIELSKTIGSYTKSIDELSKEISAVTANTNHLTDLARNEQRSKGSLNLKIKKADVYVYKMGGNNYKISRRRLEQGLKPLDNFIDIPLILQVKGDELLVSGMIRDENESIIVSILNNEWAVNKNLCYSLNHTNKGIEVMDTKGFLVLQIIVDEETLQIQLLDRRPSGAIIVNNRITRSIRNDDPEFTSAMKSTKEFMLTTIKYKIHGEDYFGKKANPNGNQ